MNIIAAVDRNFAIGKGNELLVSIPKDRQLFMNETLGKTVVMGRKTFESLPGGQPLYGRENIVLSADASFAPKGVTVFKNFDDALHYLRKLPSDSVYIIGGESIYREFLPYCDTLHLTKIDYAYDGDRHFPDISEDREWYVEEESDEETYFDLAYTFVRYRRKRR